MEPVIRIIRIIRMIQELLILLAIFFNFYLPILENEQGINPVFIHIVIESRDIHFFRREEMNIPIIIRLS